VYTNFGNGGTQCGSRLEQGCNSLRDPLIWPPGPALTPQIHAEPGPWLAHSGAQIVHGAARPVCRARIRRDRDPARRCPRFRVRHTPQQLQHELRKQRGTSNSMILVPLFDLKFLAEFAGRWCRNFKSAALAKQAKIAGEYTQDQYGAPRCCPKRPRIAPGGRPAPIERPFPMAPRSRKQIRESHRQLAPQGEHRRP